jgi:hypothetical protein
MKMLEENRITIGETSELNYSRSIEILEASGNNFP